MYRIALSHTQSVHDAQDVVQDIFIKYISLLPLFKDAKHEQAWFIRSTVNKCHDLFRRKKIRNYLSLDEISNSIKPQDNNNLSYQTAETTENILDIMKALASVKEKNRVAIILHYLEGFSVEEIALMLDISISSVKMRLSRGRENMKNIIMQEEQ